MAYDGSIIYKADLDTKDLVKELDSTKRKIQNLKEQIYKKEQEKLPLVKQSKELSAALDQAKRNLYEMQNATTGKFSSAEIKAQADYVNELQREYNKIENSIEAINNANSRTNISLDLEKQRAGALEVELAKSAKQASKIGKNTKSSSKAMEQLDKRAKRFKNRLREIVAGALVFNLISAGLRGMVEWFGKAVKQNDEARAAIAKLKGALMTLAQPITEEIIPALTQFILVLSRVVIALADFTSGLFGSTLKESASAAESFNKESEALEGIGDAAKDAAKNLSGLDEVNRWQTATENEDYIAPDFEVGEGGMLSSILNFTIDDILFDWGEDLTAENIITKIVTILTIIGGAYIGFSVGGFGGAVVGAILGAVLGITLGSLIFNNDGTLSGQEIVDAIVALITMICGGIIGFAIGNVPGAIIGFTISAGIVALIKTIEADTKSAQDLATEAIEAEVERLSQVSVDIRAKINSVTGEIDDETKTELELAERLLDEIFEIDAKDNKTAGEIERLNTLITNLNGMKLDGLQLIFDETTGHINMTRQEVDALMEDTKKQYRLEAMKEQLVKAYKAEMEAEDAKNAAEVTLAEAERNKGEADTRFSTASGALNAIEAMYSQDQYGQAAKLFNPDWWKAARDFEKAAEEADAATAVYEAALAQAEIARQDYADAMETIGIAESRLDDFVESESKSEHQPETNGESTDNASDSMDDFSEGVDNASDSMDDFSEGVEDATDATKTFDRNIGSVLSFINGILKETKPTIPGTDIPIPGLARGAVIPPNREFLAVLGDQRSGTNIEAPLETIKQAVAEVMAGVGGNNYTVNATANGRVLFQFMISEAENVMAQTGRNPFNLA